MTNKLNNASVFITGANGGIGAETVKLLLKENIQHLTLATRSQQAGDKLKEKVQPDTINKTSMIAAGGFDMLDPSSIENAVANLPEDIVYDVVFLQAGGMVVADNFRFVNKSGKDVERTIYQNVIGAYITLSALESKGKISENARIVFPGGEGSRGLDGLINKPEFTSVKELQDYVHTGSGKYSDIDALGASKFMSALLVQKLAKNDPKREYVWFSPGLTGGTQGLKDVPQPKRFIMENIGFPLMQLVGFAQSPHKAASKYLDALKGIHGKSGDLIGAPEGKGLGNLVDQKPMNDGFTNQSFIQAFYDIAENENIIINNQKIAS